MKRVSIHVMTNYIRSVFCDDEDGIKSVVNKIAETPEGMGDFDYSNRPKGDECVNKSSSESLEESQTVFDTKSANGESKSETESKEESESASIMAIEITSSTDLENELTTESEKESNTKFETPQIMENEIEQIEQQRTPPPNVSSVTLHDELKTEKTFNEDSKTGGERESRVEENQLTDVSEKKSETITFETLRAEEQEFEMIHSRNMELMKALDEEMAENVRNKDMLAERIAKAEIEVQKRLELFDLCIQYNKEADEVDKMFEKLNRFDEYLNHKATVVDSWQCWMDEFKKAPKK